MRLGRGWETVTKEPANTKFYRFQHLSLQISIDPPLRATLLKINPQFITLSKLCLRNGNILYDVIYIIPGSSVEVLVNLLPKTEDTLFIMI